MLYAGMTFGQVADRFTDLLSTSQWLDNGAPVLVTPVLNSSRTLVVLAGMHGNDRCGTKALDEWLRSDYRPMEGVRVVLVPVLNDQGFEQNQMAYHGVDLNRMFPPGGRAPALLQSLMSKLASMGGNGPGRFADWTSLTLTSSFDAGPLVIQRADCEGDAGLGERIALGLACPSMRLVAESQEVDGSFEAWMRTLGCVSATTVGAPMEWTEPTRVALLRRVVRDVYATMGPTGSGSRTTRGRPITRRGVSTVHEYTRGGIGYDSHVDPMDDLSGEYVRQMSDVPEPRGRPLMEVFAETREAVEERGVPSRIARALAETPDVAASLRVAALGIAAEQARGVAAVATEADGLDAIALRLATATRQNAADRGRAVEALDSDEFRARVARVRRRLTQSEDGTVTHRLASGSQVVVGVATRSVQGVEGVRVPDGVDPAAVTGVSVDGGRIRGEHADYIVIDDVGPAMETDILTGERVTRAELDLRMARSRQFVQDQTEAIERRGDAATTPMSEADRARGREALDRMVQTDRAAPIDFTQTVTAEEMRGLRTALEAGGPPVGEGLVPQGFGIGQDDAGFREPMRMTAEQVRRFREEWERQPRGPAMVVGVDMATGPDLSATVRVTDDGDGFTAVADIPQEPAGDVLDLQASSLTPETLREGAARARAQGAAVERVSTREAWDRLAAFVPPSMRDRFPFLFAPMMGFMGGSGAPRTRRPRVTMLSAVDAMARARTVPEFDGIWETRRGELFERLDVGQIAAIVHAPAEELASLLELPPDTTVEVMGIPIDGLTHVLFLLRLLGCDDVVYRGLEVQRVGHMDRATEDVIEAWRHSTDGFVNVTLAPEGVVDADGETFAPGSVDWTHVIDNGRSAESVVRDQSLALAPDTAMDADEFNARVMRERLNRARTLTGHEFNESQWSFAESRVLEDGFSVPEGTLSTGRELRLERAVRNWLRDTLLVPVPAVTGPGERIPDVHDAVAEDLSSEDVVRAQHPEGFAHTLGFDYEVMVERLRRAEALLGGHFSIADWHEAERAVRTVSAEGWQEPTARQMEFLVMAELNNRLSRTEARAMPFLPLPERELPAELEGLSRRWGQPITGVMYRTAEATVRRRWSEEHQTGGRLQFAAEVERELAEHLPAPRAARLMPNRAVTALAARLTDRLGRGVTVDDVRVAETRALNRLALSNGTWSAAAMERLVSDEIERGVGSGLMSANEVRAEQDMPAMTPQEQAECAPTVDSVRAQNGLPPLLNGYGTVALTPRGLQRHEIYVAPGAAEGWTQVSDGFVIDSWMSYIGDAAVRRIAVDDTILVAQLTEPSQTGGRVTVEGMVPDDVATDPRPNGHVLTAEQAQRAGHGRWPGSAAEAIRNPPLGSGMLSVSTRYIDEVAHLGHVDPERLSETMGLAPSTEVVVARCTGPQLDGGPSEYLLCRSRATGRYLGGVHVPVTAASVQADADRICAEVFGEATSSLLSADEARAAFEGPQRPLEAPRLRLVADVARICDVDITTLQLALGRSGINQVQVVRIPGPRLNGRPTIQVLCCDESVPPRVLGGVVVPAQPVGVAPWAHEGRLLSAREAQTAIESWGRSHPDTPNPDVRTLTVSEVAAACDVVATTLSRMLGIAVDQPVDFARVAGPMTGGHPTILTAFYRRPGAAADTARAIAGVVTPVADTPAGRREIVELNATSGEAVTEPVDPTPQQRLLAQSGRRLSVAEANSVREAWVAAHPDESAPYATMPLATVAHSCGQDPGVFATWLGMGSDHLDLLFDVMRVQYVEERCLVTQTLVFGHDGGRVRGGAVQVREITEADERGAFEEANANATNWVLENMERALFTGSEPDPAPPTRNSFEETLGSAFPDERVYNELRQNPGQTVIGLAELMGMDVDGLVGNLHVARTARIVVEQVARIEPISPGNHATYHLILARDRRYIGAIGVINGQATMLPLAYFPSRLADGDVLTGSERLDLHDRFNTLLNDLDRRGPFMTTTQLPDPGLASRLARLDAQLAAAGIAADTGTAQGLRALETQGAVPVATMPALRETEADRIARERNEAYGRTGTDLVARRAAAAERRPMVDPAVLADIPVVVGAAREQPFVGMIAELARDPAVRASLEAAVAGTDQQAAIDRIRATHPVVRAVEDRARRRRNPNG